MKKPVFSANVTVMVLLAIKNMSDQAEEMWKTSTVDVENVQDQ